MTVTLNLKNRRCRNRAPHEGHSWRGLNTRGAGYYCVGREGAPAQVIDLMQALKDSLRARGGIAPASKRPDLLDELHDGSAGGR